MGQRWFLIVAIVLLWHQGFQKGSNHGGRRYPERQWESEQIIKKAFSGGLTDMPE